LIEGVAAAKAKMVCRKRLFNESGHSREKDGGTCTPQRQQMVTLNDATDGQNSVPVETSGGVLLVSANDDPHSVGGQSRMTGRSSCPEESAMASPGYKTPTRTAWEKGIGAQEEITPTIKGAGVTSSGAACADRRRLCFRL
jgi:hypothetical protein